MTGADQQKRRGIDLNSTGSVGVLLAGGRSTRMGSPKGLTLLGGESLAAKSLAVLREVFPEVVLVTNEPEIYRELQVPLTPDLHPDLGPLAGIEAGLTWARSAGAPGIVCLPCDAPFAEAELVRRLLAHASGSTAVLPRSGSPLGYEPLFAWYSVTALEIAAVHISQRRSAMHSFVESLPDVVYLSLEEVREIAEPDVLFFNVNTPDDLERARRTEAERKSNSA